MTESDCLFCKLIRKEIPANVVYEDDETIAFLDIHPVTRGHTLVIPKKHATNIFDMPAGSWAAVAQTVHALAPRLESSLKAQGLNIMMNNRSHAGQVIDHPHVHLIPRYSGDGLVHWRSGTYHDDEQSTVLETIRAAL